MLKISSVGIILLASGLFAQAPRAPLFTVTPLDNAVLVAWDSLSEPSPNIFNGYRLYRARLSSGPFANIREWRPTATTAGNSPLIHSFLDIGDDDANGALSADEGLRNELTYYYALVAFADSVITPYRPATESPQTLLLAIPRSSVTNYAPSPIVLSGQTGTQGDVQSVRLVITSPGNFRRFFEGHTITVAYTTVAAGGAYFIPVTVTDKQVGFTSTYFLNPGLLYTGDSANAGPLHGTFVGENIFASNAFNVLADWKYTQLAPPLRLDTVIQITQDPSTNTPIQFRDTIIGPYVGLKGVDRTLGESTYEIEFLAGGVDTINAGAKQIFNYLNIKVTEAKTGRVIQPGDVSDFSALPHTNEWTLSRYAFNTTINSIFIPSKAGANKYYYYTFIDTSAIWEFSNILTIENTRVVFDYANKGRTPGRNWPLAPYKATKDFQAGDKVRIVVIGGVAGNLPYQALLTYTIGAAPQVQATASILEQIRVVPNPYLIRHAAQQSPSSPSLRFDYLPEVCDIRIYTLSLELVKTLLHRSGSVEFWDMTNRAGNRVGSQMFIAHISEPGGNSVLKKFSVILGE